MEHFTLVFSLGATLVLSRARLWLLTVCPVAPCTACSVKGWLAEASHFWLLPDALSFSSSACSCFMYGYQGAVPDGWSWLWAGARGTAPRWAEPAAWCVGSLVQAWRADGRRTGSQAETRQLLGHEAAGAGSRIWVLNWEQNCRDFLAVGLAEWDQAAFLHGPDHLTSPNNTSVTKLSALVPQGYKRGLCFCLVHLPAASPTFCHLMAGFVREPSNKHLDQTELLNFHHQSVLTVHTLGGQLLLVHTKDQK